MQQGMPMTEEQRRQQMMLQMMRQQGMQGSGMQMPGQPAQPQMSPVAGGPQQSPNEPPPPGMVNQSAMTPDEQAAAYDASGAQSSLDRQARQAELMRGQIGKRMGGTQAGSIFVADSPLEALGALGQTYKANKADRKVRRAERGVANRTEEAAEAQTRLKKAALKASQTREDAQLEDKQAFEESQRVAGEKARAEAAAAERKAREQAATTLYGRQQATEKAKTTTRRAESGKSFDVTVDGEVKRVHESDVGGKLTWGDADGLPLTSEEAARAIAYKAGTSGSNADVKSFAKTAEQEAEMRAESDAAVAKLANNNSLIDVLRSPLLEQATGFLDYRRWIGTFGYGEDGGDVQALGKKINDLSVNSVAGYLSELKLTPVSNTDLEFVQRPGPDKNTQPEGFIEHGMKQMGVIDRAFKDAIAKGSQEHTPEMREAALEALATAQVRAALNNAIPLDGVIAKLAPFGIDPQAIKEEERAFLKELEAAELRERGIGR